MELIAYSKVYAKDVEPLKVDFQSENDRVKAAQITRKIIRKKGMIFQIAVVKGNQKAAKGSNETKYSKLRNH